MKQDYESLMRAIGHLRAGARCALRIIELGNRPEDGITDVTRAMAATEVLQVAVARADGNLTAVVSQQTMKVMVVVLADVELRLLWDRLGLTNWRPGT